MDSTFDIPVSLKVRLIAEQLIEIGGKPYYLNFNDLNDNSDNFNYWTSIDPHEIWINHQDKSLDVLLLDRGHASYEVDEKLLIVGFGLDAFYCKKISGERLLEEIGNAISLGIKEFKKQCLKQQLNLFEDPK